MEPPSKRRRLSIDQDTGETGLNATEVIRKGENIAAGIGAKPIQDPSEDELRREIRAGITAYVNPNTRGFSGILKTRYTDFLVNEVLTNGKVLHLTNLVPPSKHHKIVAGSERPRDVVRDEATDRIEASPQDRKTGSAPRDEFEGGEGEVSEIGKNSKEIQATLFPIFGEEITEKIISLHAAIILSPLKKPKDFKAVRSGTIADKAERTNAHQLIRRLFDSKLETKTSENETILITAAGKAPMARGGPTKNEGPTVKNRIGWQELGGEYLHFTLYKENRDTMEAISYLASQLKVNPKHFQYGGTKDRRAVTVQRCSTYRIHAEQLANVGKRLRGSKVGDFDYRPNGLELGMLGGNEFVITLRDCHFVGDDARNIGERINSAQNYLSKLVDTFKQRGFINYYGLQRFGSFTTSTDEIGTKLLQGDLAGAVSKILAFNPIVLEEQADLISHDDRARAKAIDIWNTSQNGVRALDLLPRKFSAESNIIRHLSSRNKHTGQLANLKDYQGALNSIPRNLRLMYLHAYQSLVWNTIAGKRWKSFGSRVVKGDLVLISEHKSKQKDQGTGPQAVDEQGEVIILPSASTVGASDQIHESPYEQARALTAQEAESGDYGIFDIVLPLPGYDVVYPDNDIGEEYKMFMSSEAGGGLDPHGMRRSWRDLSLSGSYRKLLGRPGEGMRFEIKPYERDEEQLVETDLERLEKHTATPGVESQRKHMENQTMVAETQHQLPAEKKVAVVLWMKLLPSQYATMALRELLKEGGLKTFKPEFGHAR